jgi:hypothetical protein
VIFLLGNWNTHAEYQTLMVKQINKAFKRNPKEIEHYESAILKMFYLDLDCVKDDFEPLFSVTGRPSNQQPEIFRSFILMSHFKYADIDSWVAHASSAPILCSLVGVDENDFPGASTHRDFIDRLWMADKPVRLKPSIPKPKGKLGKQKQPVKHPRIVAYLVEKALSGKVFHAIPERLLQSIFMKTAVLPSAIIGLLGDTNNLVISGDGTCINSHASPHGHKTCKCSGSCNCPKSFADPSAKWGWDSYHEQWFYGFTAYLLSVHNKNLKLDLPIYLKFTDASRHDSVSSIAAITHARFLYKDFIRFDSFLADAAHDNYPTYRLLNEWNIKPFIDLNNRSDNKLQIDNLILSDNGVPVCPDGHLMLNWGYDAKTSRIKYRCPMVTGNVKFCPYNMNCNKSLYGKIVYVRLASNLRFLTPVPRDSPLWLETYNMRTASERVNNRILTDYQLERPKRYGKSKLAFFAFFNVINIHLDAQVKVGKLTISNLSA